MGRRHFAFLLEITFCAIEEDAYLGAELLTTETLASEMEA